MKSLFGQSSFLPALCSIVALLVGVSSCGDDSTGPVKRDPDAAAEKVIVANAALENILFSLPDDVSHPDDLDFRPASVLYEEALVLDPDNLDAHLGVGVTGLLTLTTDSEVNAAFDEWEAYLEEHTPFRAESSSGGPLGIPIGFMPSAASLRLPFPVATFAVIARLRSPLHGTDPQISRIQAILRDRVLPLVESAVNHLDQVVDDEDYMFTITPKMQGDLEASAKELDRTDILTTEAGLKLLSAACRIAVSYRLNLAAYDSTSLYQVIQRGSGWLALDTNGGTQMSKAGGDLMGAVDDLEDAITSLLAEEESDPNQDDDLIKTDNSDLTRQDLTRFRDEDLPKVRDLLTGRHTFTEDWDNRSFTPDMPLAISLAPLFNPPFVQDWKALLPAYAGTVGRVNDQNLYSVSDQAQATVTVSVAGDYSGTYQLWQYVTSGEPNETYSGSLDLRPALEQLVQFHLAEIALDPDWSGYFFGSTSFSGTLAQGVSTIGVDVLYEYSLREGNYVPVITWQADSFQEMTLPDPTFRGILPEITSTAELWQVLGVSEFNWIDGGWEKELVIDWTN